MILDLIVEIHHVQNIQQLTLVLMQTLYLHVEDGARIYIDTIVLLNIFCKTLLVLILDIHELLKSLLVVRIDFQLGNLRQICDPLITDMFGYPVCKQRVSMKKESSLCDTIGLVVELLRHLS